MTLDPNQLAISYYFGDLQYWKLPKIAADALEAGYDGPAIRELAGVFNPVECEFPSRKIDAAFREMGVAAPISKDRAILILAEKSAEDAIHGGSNVFDAATHIRIHLCGFKEPPQELSRIVALSNEAKNAPRSEWDRIESELKEAFSEFLSAFA